MTFRFRTAGFILNLQPQNQAQHDCFEEELEIRLAALAGLLSLLVDELDGLSALALLAPEEELDIIASSAAAVSPSGWGHNGWCFHNNIFYFRTPVGKDNFTVDSHFCWGNLKKTTNGYRFLSIKSHSFECGLRALSSVFGEEF